MYQQDESVYSNTAHQQDENGDCTDTVYQQVESDCSDQQDKENVFSDGEMMIDIRDDPGAALEESVLIFIQQEAGEGDTVAAETVTMETITGSVDGMVLLEACSDSINDVSGAATGVCI